MGNGFVDVDSLAGDGVPVVGAEVVVAGRVVFAEFAAEGRGECRDVAGWIEVGAFQTLKPVGRNVAGEYVEIVAHGFEQSYGQPFVVGWYYKQGCVCHELVEWFALYEACKDNAGRTCLCFQAFGVMVGVVAVACNGEAAGVAEARGMESLDKVVKALFLYKSSDCNDIRLVGESPLLYI